MGQHDELGADGVLSSSVPDEPLQFPCHQEVTEVPLIQLAKDATAELDPKATPFVARDRIMGGLDDVNLVADQEHVLQVQAGGVGHQGLVSSNGIWNKGVVIGCKTGQASKIAKRMMEGLPFADVDNIPDMMGIAPKDIHKVGSLRDMQVKLPVGAPCS